MQYSIIIQKSLARPELVNKKKIITNISEQLENSVEIRISKIGLILLYFET